MRYTLESAALADGKSDDAAGPACIWKADSQIFNRELKAHHNGRASPIVQMEVCETLSSLLLLCGIVEFALFRSPSA
jgi:hypothetical protein